MRSLLRFLLVAVLVGAFVRLAPAQKPFPEPPLVHVGKIPAITLSPEKPLDAAETIRIKSLIKQLAHVNHIDFGFSPTTGGTAFAPIPDQESAQAMVLTKRDLKTSHPFTELVRLGPDALPLLLDALDDTTPTKISVKLEGILTWMTFSNEIDGNPANARERKIIAALPQKGLGSQPNIPESSYPTGYVLTVGDLCFDIIGEIVGRGYSAVRYQMSGGVVVNSPTHDPAIARAVRAIWSSDHPTQHLLDSLLLDYATRGILQKGKNAELDSGWEMGSSYQSLAVIRLLFYFPRQSVPMIARRLNRLQVYGVPVWTDSSSDRYFAQWEKRELTNEVRTEDFLKAVAWCGEREIRAALLALFQRSDDPDSLRICLSALDPIRHGSIVYQRLGWILRRLPLNEDRRRGSGSDILIAAWQFGGEKARPLFRGYLKRRSIGHCFFVCIALVDTKGEWDREFLLPMLSDKRTDNEYTHSVKPDSNYPELPIRICDQAAEIICLHRKDVKFKMVGTKQQLDRQIRLIRQRLATHPKPPKQ